MTKIKSILAKAGLVFLLLVLEFLGRGIALLGDSPLFPLLGLLILLVSCGLAMYLAYRWQLLKKGVTPWNKQTFKTIGLAFLASRLVQVLGLAILALEKGLDAQPANQQALDSLPLPLYFIAFTAAVSAPILEELLFRGVIMGKIFSPTSYWGLVISSLLFGLVHSPTDIGSWGIYAGGGFVLGWLYRKTGRLDYCMVLHFINNGLAMLLLIVATLFGLT